MSSIINNSNSNSALVNTLESSNSMTNPNVYSTKEVYPTSATVWTKCQLSNGGTGNSDTINFNLNKYGIIEQILVQYEKTCSTAATVIPAGDLFNCVEKVELLSGSRTTSILTGADLVAQFSNLPASQYNVVHRTAVTARGGSGGVAHTYCFPLTFGFMQDINTQLNASFLEPLSIRITWGVNTKFVTSGAGTSSGLSNCFLNVRYKSYPEQPTAQILASNYNAPELVQVSTRFYDENPQTFKYTSVPADGLGQSEPIDLRNTDCVESFYILVREVLGTGDTGRLGPCEQIRSIRFLGSGQEILSLGQEQMEYASLCDNGFSQSGIGVNDAMDVYNMRKVFKIQTGLYEYANGGPLSNTVSLREINAPQIIVQFDAPGATAEAPKSYRIDIVENCTAIYSTSSAVGRLTLALSN